MNQPPKPPPEIFGALDLELNQPSGKIIQIGIVVGNIFTGEIIEKLSIFINPHEALSEFIKKLTGITQEQVDAGAELADAYPAICSLWERHKVFMNPLTWGGGDSREVREQLGIKPEAKFVFGHRWKDVKTVWQAHCEANGRPSQGGLAKSLTKMGLNFKGRKHNALDDAFNTFLFYVELVKRMKTEKTSNDQPNQQEG